MPENNFPSGMVTFMFTDVENSTRMTNELGDERYRFHLRNPHRTRLLESVERNHGFEIQRVGDGHMCVFQDPDDALKCAVQFQQSLAQGPIRYNEHEVKVRIGLHTATKSRKPTPLEDGLVRNHEKDGVFVEYSGEDTNYASRISGLGAGGQIIFSAETHQRANSAKELRLLIDEQDLTLHPWANRYLKSFEAGPQTVHEILYFEGQQPKEPGSRFFPAFYKGEKNRYIAREKQEKLVLEQFATPQKNEGKTARLVTIHAEGGMGKTRLSVACALKMIGVFKNGAYFISLSDIVSGVMDGEAKVDLSQQEKDQRDELLKNSVAESIGRELDLPGAQARPDALLQYLCDKEILLILDNYESVVCDEVGMYLCEFITETRGICLLATGRQPVGADVEKIISLNDGMTEDEARELFMERAARKWSPGRTLTADEDIQLARILRLTSTNPDTTNPNDWGGPIPLAIELAAAWVTKRTLEEIADGLEGTALGEPTMPPPGGFRSDDKRTNKRHSSLERSLTWSYDLIGQTAGRSAQRTFAEASLFATTFDAATLNIVCGRNARSDLDALHNASLVRRVEVDGNSRYYLHRFTREYATARFTELNEANDVRSRFVAHYVKIVQETEDLNDAHNRNILEREWRNVVAAADTAAILKDVAALTSFGEIWKFFDLRGLWAEWEKLTLQALLLCRESEEHSGEGKTLRNLGTAYWRQGRWSEAEQNYEESITIFRNISNRSEEGKALGNLGIVYQSQGLWSEAEEVFGQSLAITREFKDRLGEGRMLTNLGIVYESQGRWEEAEKVHAQSLTISREFKDRLGEGRTLMNLGIVYESQDCWSEAEEVFGQSLAIMREFKDRLGEGSTLMNLALLWWEQDDLPKAVKFAREAVSVLEGTQDTATLEQARRILMMLEE